VACSLIAFNTTHRINAHAARHGSSEFSHTATHFANQQRCVENFLHYFAAITGSIAAGGMHFSRIFITLIFQGRFMMRWLLAAVCLFFSGTLLGQVQVGCPAGQECVPIQYYDWCGVVGANCFGEQLSTTCPERSNNPSGGRNYADMTDWFIRSEKVCNGYISGIATPNNVETTDDLLQYKEPVTKRQRWNLAMVNAMGSTVDIVYQVGLSRGHTCPIGFTFIGGKTDLCKREPPIVNPKNLACCSEEKTGSPALGNPINTAVANKVQRETDYSGSGEFPLLFMRTYNSIYSVPYSSMGSYWRTTYDRSLTFASATRVVAYRADGRSYTYNLNGASWVSDLDVSEKLLAITDTSNAIISWKLTTLGDEVEIYAATGKLQSITNRAGFTQTLIYSDAQTARAIAPYAGLLIKVIDHNGRELRFTYDAKNRLETMTEPDGRVNVYTYDLDDRLLARTTPSDNKTRSYVYNEAAYTQNSNQLHKLTGIVDENNQRYATFFYDTTGRAIATEHAGSVDRVGMVYSTNAATATTANGVVLNYNFTTQHGLKKVSSVSKACATCPGGVATRTNTYDANGYMNVQTDFTGTTSDSDYNARGLLTQKIESVNQAATKRTTQTDWHASFNVPTERRVLNAANVLEARTTYTHNTRGQTTAMCQIDPNNTTAMAYVCGSATNAPVGVRQSTMTYCEPADVTAGTCPIVGLMLSSNGPRTDVSDINTYTYYPTDAANCATAPTTCAYRKGDLWKVTNALNHVLETTAYDGAGRVLQMKDANNVITDMQYHPRGWLTHRKVRGSDNATEADDAITTMDYDATGQVIKVTQPDGDFINFSYDAAHRLIGISDALNNSISYTLDNAGNRTAETTKDPSNVIKRSLSRVYDTLGRLQASKNAASATVATLTYDANDNLNTSTDGLNRITDQDVDPLNRLIKTIQDQGAGKINATTQFEYDARDNLTKVIDPKNLNTVYSYSGLNDLTQLSSPDTGSTAYTYDSAGNRKTQTDARNVTSTYSYDSANRLTQVSLPSATQNVFFDYDATQTDCQATETFTTGRLARIRDESGSTRYCYNRLGQSVRKVQSVTGGPNLSLGSTYNGANRMIAMTYPSGAIVTYLRNAKGQITGIDAKPTAAAAQVSLISNATYLPFGPLNTLTFGNSRVLTKAYDQNYDIDKVSDNSPTGLSQDSTVNLMGNITAITERTTATANTTRQFAYDNLDRLLSLKNGATNIQSFTYDATGNRLNKTLGTTVTTNTIAATSHRLTQDGATARTYDANGNTTTIGVKGYVYDDRNRLRDYKNSGSTVTRTYRYNGKGERVSKVVSATSTSNRYFFYDEAGHLLGEYLPNGTRVQEYVWLDDQLIAVLSDHDASTYQFVETDHLGTPRAVIHPVENNIAWRWNITNTAFGEHTATNNPDGDAVTYTFNLRYPGQLYDSESGLHYNRFRDYEPGRGGYIESDPIGLAGGISTYGYVGGNPVTGFDPLGLFNATAYEVPNSSGSYDWVYKFDFSNGCKVAAALAVGEFFATRSSKVGNWAGKLATGVERLSPDPAGDADLSDLEERCKCLNYDPELKKYFKETLHYSTSDQFNQAQADGIITALRGEFKRLKKTKCGGDKECMENNNYYKWNEILGKARARGIPALRRAAERATQ
jgi:RHS repeat-associated protein